MNFIIVFSAIALLSNQGACQNGKWMPSLLTALEEALLSETDNFINLQTLYYPPQYIQTDTLSIAVRHKECDFTVKKVNRILVDKPALTECHCRNCTDCYCLNSSQVFYLSETAANSNSYYRLKNYINSDDVIEYIKFVDTASFLLFNLLTHSQLNQTSNGYRTKNVHIILHIEELEEMPTQADLISNLKTLFMWVSTAYCSCMPSNFMVHTNHIMHPTDCLNCTVNLCVWHSRVSYGSRYNVALKTLICKICKQLAKGTHM